MRLTFWCTGIFRNQVSNLVYFFFFYYMQNEEYLPDFVVVVLPIGSVVFTQSVG